MEIKVIHLMEINKIYHGDTLSVLKTFPAEWVDCIITSPPYFGLRNYGVDGQLGLENSFEEYLQKILLITAEIKRVLKQSGTFWLNFGDAYGSDALLYDNGDKAKQDFLNHDFSSQNQSGVHKDILKNRNPDKLCPVHGQSPEVSDKNQFHNEDRNDHSPNEDFSHEENRKTFSEQGQGRVSHSKYALKSAVQESKKATSSSELQESVSNQNREEVFPSLNHSSFSDVELNECICLAYPYSTISKSPIKGFDRQNYGGLGKKRQNTIRQGRGRRGGTASKCLMMMPERIAIRLIDNQGWILRNKIKWAKQVLLKKQNKTVGSVMPSSVKDRFNESAEELYFFVKNKKYYFDLDAVRIKNQVMGITDMRDAGVRRSIYYEGSKYNQNPNYNSFNYRVRDSVRKEGQPQYVASQEERDNYNSDYGRKKLKYLSLEEKQSLNRWASATPNVMYKLSKKNVVTFPHKEGRLNEYNNIGGKNLPTIWQIGSEPHNFQKELGMETDHFAVFPQLLLELPIKAGCPPNGIVLDPFMGSGTTGLVAKKLGRSYIGIELNKEYIQLAERRINAVLI